MRYITILMLLSQMGCSFKEIKPNETPWYYKLQNYNNSDFEDVSNSIIVIDLYKSIGPDEIFSKKKIDQIKKNKNLAIAYFSIGEAEDYRPNFKKIPKSILGKENKNWKGNFNINYWDKRWHDIVLNYLDLITVQGFNGVYLDIIDAFHRYPDKKKAAESMLKLIEKISERSKEKNRNFKIILQNGIDIIDYLTPASKTVLLKVIDGIAIEDYLFQNNKVENNNEILTYLSFYKDKLKLSVEYSKNTKDKEKYLNLCQKYMLLPLITDKELKGKYYIFK